MWLCIADFSRKEEGGTWGPVCTGFERRKDVCGYVHSYSGKNLSFIIEVTERA